MKNYCLLTIMNLFFLNAYCQSIVTLQEGSIVKIVLNENLDSRVSKVGDLVNLEVNEDVIVDNVIIIKKGDKAIGRISKSNPAKWAGKKGELDFTIDYVTSYLGKNIRIRSVNDAAGTSRMGGVIAGAAIINPFVLLVKGKNITINKGAVFSTYVDKDYEFNKTDIMKGNK